MLFTIVTVLYIRSYAYKQKFLPVRGLRGGSGVKTPPADAGDMGSILDLETSHVAWST